MTSVGDSNNESEESLRIRECNSETLIGKPVVQKSTIFTETGGIDVGSPNQEQSLSFALPACAFQALLASEYGASDPTGAEICALHAAAVNVSVEEWMALTEELGVKKTYLLRTNLQQMSKSTDDGMAPSLRTPPKMDHKMRFVSGIEKPNTGITLLDILNGKPDKKITISLSPKCDQLHHIFMLNESGVFGEKLHDLGIEFRCNSKDRSFWIIMHNPIDFEQRFEKVHNKQLNARKQAPYPLFMALACAIRSGVIQERDSKLADEARGFDTKEEFDSFRFTAIARLDDSRNQAEKEVRIKFAETFQKAGYTDLGMMNSSKELAASAEEHEDMKEKGLQRLRGLELKVVALLR